MSDTRPSTIPPRRDHRDAYVRERLSRESAAMHKAIGTYEAFHAARFDYVLVKARELRPDRETKVLDVGRSYLTLRLLAYYDDVSTLGFPLERQSFTGIDGADGQRKSIRAHIVYDLNRAQTATPIDSDETFDLIVFAEVLEHLHTAPELTLSALKRLMAPGGHMIIQTPNAAALHKRLLLMAGRNPYERIRIDTGNPGHFREYTRRELIDYTKDVGLDVVAHEYRDYFGATINRRAIFAAYKAIVRVVPALARGQTLIVRNPV